MKCRLCKMEKKTHWYYSDDTVVICDCDTCHKPMVVLRKHTMKPNVEEMMHMLTKVEEMFGENVWIRLEQRDIKDYLHWHVLK